MDARIEKLLTEIQDRLSRIESSRPSRIDAMSISRSAQLPYYALCYRTTLIWRMSELSRDAFECFEKRNLASAIVLTRAAIETTAALWHLGREIQDIVKSGQLGEFGAYLTRLRLGQGKGIVRDGEPKAVHVNDFLRAVEKECDGFMHQYDSMSEFAHPNYSGTTLLYSSLDHANAMGEFGQNLRCGESTMGRGVTNLSVALMFFERSYDRVGELTPAFTTLCENQFRDTK